MRVRRIASYGLAVGLAYLAIRVGARSLLGRYVPPLHALAGALVAVGFLFFVDVTFGTLEQKQEDYGRDGARGGATGGGGSLLDASPSKLAAVALLVLLLAVPAVLVATNDAVTSPTDVYIFSNEVNVFHETFRHDREAAYCLYGGREHGDWFVTDVRFSHYGEETHVAVPDCHERTPNGSFLGIAHTHPSADTAQSQPDRWNAMWSEEYEMHAIYASSDLQFYRGGDVPTELQHRQIDDMAEYRAYRDRHPIDPIRDVVEDLL